MAAGRCAKPCSRLWPIWVLRPAEPGEFSRRAVENGRLDLTRAEAIADLVDAETPAQLRQALRQYDGALAELYEGWRAALIAALARAEAAIDFSDDGVGETEFDRPRGGGEKDHREIEHHLDDPRRGEALREGLRLTIIGPPNAGKSSLINALAQRDVGHRLRDPRHHPRCDRGAAGSGRLSGACRRYRGPARDTRCDRGRRRAPRAWRRPRPAIWCLLLLDGSCSDTDHARHHARSDWCWNKSDLPDSRSAMAFAVAEKRRRLARIDDGAHRDWWRRTAGDKERSACSHPAAPSPCADRGAGQLCSHAPGCRRISPNSSRRICAWRCAPSAASPARWMSRNCWIRCSGIFASESERLP